MEKKSYLTNMNLYSKTPIKEFTDEELVHISQQCFDFCYELFGINRRKHTPLSICIYDHSTENNWGYILEKKWGEYCAVENEIRLFKDGIRTLGEFTSTFIHEYTHSTQPITTKYYKLVKEYSYTDHPFEVEALSNEKKYNRKLLKQLRQCYHTSSTSI
ncbi:MAG: hypothetical protein WCJ92_07925 [Alphaproteobacteria bacterium]